MTGLLRYSISLLHVSKTICEGKANFVGARLSIHAIRDCSFYTSTFAFLVRLMNVFVRGTKTLQCYHIWGTCRFRLLERHGFYLNP